jgi:hypothetical protein
MTRDELLISEHLHNAALEFSTARDHAMKAIAQLENVQELGGLAQHCGRLAATNFDDAITSLAENYIVACEREAAFTARSVA